MQTIRFRNHDLAIFFCNLPAFSVPLFLKIPLMLFLFLFQLGCSKGNYLGPESADYLATASEEECGYVQNEFGQRVSWQGRLPIEFFVSSTIPSELRQDIVEAAEVWNQSSGKPVIKVNLNELDSTLFAVQDLKNSIVGFTDWDESKSTQQAVTVVKYRGNLISEADIKINLKDFIYYSKEPQNSSQVHFGSLLVHEFGHALGLKHGIQKPTVMWSTLASLMVRTKLSEVDLKSLGCEY